MTLSAAGTTTSWDEREPGRSRFELPLLTLHRQREATSEPERTLEIGVAGLAAGAQIEVEARSYHVDVSTGDRHREGRGFIADRPCSSDDPCAFRWTLDAATTPSDFYSLRVSDRAGNVLWGNPNSERPDFVALDTWDVGLGDHTVRITYATLFPVARGEQDLENRLPPAGVTTFIDDQLAPIIKEIWHTQVGEWGFGDPLHPDWDRDQMVEIIVNAPPFALFDGGGTYAETSMLKGGQPYPQRRIWWRSSLDNFAAYDSLADAYRAGLAHEFFHLMQWNVRLEAERPIDSWLNVFVEAQACAATTAQYPELELNKDGWAPRNNEYVRAANRFLTQRLNTSYRDLDAHPTERYDLALYWRFLYESFDDVTILRAALEEMGAGYDADVVSGMEMAMDRALARYDGPFHSFEGSLAAFARANYALRLENGRCAAAGVSACDGLYYDPDQVYADPPLEATLDYDGARLTHAGAVPSSYGMDFVEVRLTPATRGQPLAISLQREGTVARYSFQVWKVGPGALKPRAVTPASDQVPQREDGAHVYRIPAGDWATYDRLALIITRLDADETADPLGSYTIVLDRTE